MHDPDDAAIAAPETLATVHDTWRRVAPAGPAAGELFYRHLFEADPTLQRLFVHPLHEQGARLVQMLDIAVANLHEPRVLRGVLRELGARHRGYGVQPRHYRTVGGALLSTLEAALGPAFTPAVRAAWTEVYDAIATTMQDGAVARAA